MSALLEVEGLTKHFPQPRRLLGSRRPPVRAVDGVSFSLQPGETLALVGESGCGKSTTGRLALRLIEPTAGQIRFEGRDITGLGTAEMRALRRRMQIVFQDPFASLNPRLSVGEILAEPLALHGLDAGPDAIAALLARMGLRPEHASRFPHEFSGGQRQRIGVARAIATRPSLVICDEPVSALDVSVQAQVINLLMDLQAEIGLAYLFIAHDLAVVRHVAARVAVMYLGRLVEIGPAEALYADPRHPYTRALLAAVPRPEPPPASGRHQRASLSGDVPSPADPPSGCSFHPRCAFAEARCRQERPELRQVAGRQTACHFAEALPSVPALAAPPITEARAHRLSVLERARQSNRGPTRSVA